jgi:NADPH:quinone reductase-like Zn-dependent oxidoreductase
MGEGLFQPLHIILIIGIALLVFGTGKFAALGKGLSIRGYTLREVFAIPKLRDKAEKYVFDQINADKFKPRVDRVFPLSQIVESHRYMESNEQIGKIVVTV